MIGEYDHLNKETPLELELDLDDLADKLEAANYGTHRFLSALVRARRRSGKHEQKIANVIEKLLNDGHY